MLQLKEDIQVRSNEAQREARKKEKIEKELKQAKNDLETRTAELKTKAGNLQRAQEDITKLEQQLKEQRVGLFREIIIYSDGDDKMNDSFKFPKCWQMHVLLINFEKK